MPLLPWLEAHHTFYSQWWHHVAHLQELINKWISFSLAERRASKPDPLPFSFYSRDKNKAPRSLSGLWGVTGRGDQLRALDWPWTTPTLTWIPSLSILPYGQFCKHPVMQRLLWKAKFDNPKCRHSKALSIGAEWLAVIKVWFLSSLLGEAHLPLPILAFICFHFFNILSNQVSNNIADVSYKAPELKSLFLRHNENLNSSPGYALKQLLSVQKLNGQHKDDSA